MQTPPYRLISLPPALFHDDDDDDDDDFYHDDFGAMMKSSNKSVGSLFLAKSVNQNKPGRVNSLKVKIVAALLGTWDMEHWILPWRYTLYTILYYTVLHCILYSTVLATMSDTAIFLPSISRSFSSLTAYPIIKYFCRPFQFSTWLSQTLNKKSKQIRALLFMPMHFMVLSKCRLSRTNKSYKWKPKTFKISLIWSCCAQNKH